MSFAWVLLSLLNSSGPGASKDGVILLISALGARESDGVTYVRRSGSAETARGRNGETGEVYYPARRRARRCEPWRNGNYRQGPGKELSHEKNSKTGEESPEGGGSQNY